MADFQLASALFASESVIRGTIGLYPNQRAYASDQNGAEMFWDDTNDKWLWATHAQSIFRWYADVNSTSSTAVQELKTYPSLPILASEDSLKISALFTLGAAATKILLKFGPAVSLVDAYSMTVNATGDLGLNLEAEMRNYGDASHQKWSTPDRRVLGVVSNGSGPTLTTKNTGIAGNTLGIYCDKVASGDVVVMNWFEVSVCGGGIP